MAFPVMLKACCLIALGIFVAADAAPGRFLQANDTDACDENATNGTDCSTTTTLTTTTTIDEISVNTTDDNDTEVNVAPAPVPMTIITFSLTLQTSATCADLAASEDMMTAFKKAGSRLAGDVPTDAVAVTCAAARRLMAADARRMQTGIALTFDVTVPTSDAAAKQNAIAAIDLATATTIFNDAATEAGGSFTFTVDEAALTAMKASVVAVAVTAAPAPGPPATSTSGPGSGGESSSAFPGKKPTQLASAMVVALFAFAMGA